MHYLKYGPRYVVSSRRKPANAICDRQAPVSQLAPLRWQSWGFRSLLLSARSSTLKAPRQIDEKAREYVQKGYSACSGAWYHHCY
jgi:hypothetical protein